MARQRSHRSRRRRRGRFGGLYRFFAVLAVIAAVAAACVIFFRVNEVSVVGNVRYTAEEIVQISGIQSGDNLITLSKAHIAGVIRTRLPYVESVSIRRSLPDGVIIEVHERVAVASVESDQGSWLISSQGKVLEEKSSASVMEIIGIMAQSPRAGDSVRVLEKDSATLDHVLALLTALEEENMIAACGTMDCTAAASILLSWDIYTIKLPRGGDYSCMLGLIKNALNNERMPQGVPGTFDLVVEDGAVHFIRAK